MTASEPAGADPTHSREVGIDVIQTILPHRYPFLLVDKVRDIVPDVSATGIKCVTANEPQFTGHFPGQPIMPGVMIIEAMAQTCGVLMGVSRGMDATLMIYFTTIDKVKFRRTVVPGDVLEMKVEIKRGGTKVGKFEGRAFVEGQLVAQAEFTAMLQDATAADTNPGTPG
ncbi:MAG: 3-hydroxyacyl-ACP dehydratase FabZ [Pseudomonadota bacterium]